MKAMISQPMAGLNDEQIIAAREQAIKFLESKGYEIVNTLFTDEWYSRINVSERSSTDTVMLSGEVPRNHEFVSRGVWRILPKGGKRREVAE